MLFNSYSPHQAHLGLILGKLFWRIFFAGLRQCRVFLCPVASSKANAVTARCGSTPLLLGGLQGRRHPATENCLKLGLMRVVERCEWNVYRILGENVHE